MSYLITFVAVILLNNSLFAEDYFEHHHGPFLKFECDIERSGRLRADIENVGFELYRANKGQNIDVDVSIPSQTKIHVKLKQVISTTYIAAEHGKSNATFEKAVQTTEYPETYDFSGLISSDVKAFTDLVDAFEISFVPVTNPSEQVPKRNLFFKLEKYVGGSYKKVEVADVDAPPSNKLRFKKCKIF